jgi:very-short-patch-repair endonuclease
VRAGTQMPPSYRGSERGVVKLKQVRHLRRELTDAERRLWYLVRDRHLGGWKFRRQYEIGPYILDFYCAERKILVEADGSQHLTPEGVQHDVERTAFLESQGVKVMRFDNLEILTQTDAVAEMILKELGDRPSP